MLDAGWFSATTTQQALETELDGNPMKILFLHGWHSVPGGVKPKYLKDHCAVRWLQLDEGARELAHFAIAVLRPVVNE